jgi:hypothetical protein
MSMHISYADNTMPLEAIKAQPKTAELAQGTQYSLNLINDSAQAWTFYVYQKMPAQVADVFSLAWFCSPYMIRVGDNIRFTWEIEYNFVWSDTGQLIPGVTFDAGGTEGLQPVGKNTTEFSLTPGPGLSDPLQGPAGRVADHQ